MQRRIGVAYSITATGSAMTPGGTGAFAHRMAAVLVHGGGWVMTMIAIEKRITESSKNARNNEIRRRATERRHEIETSDERLETVAVDVIS